MKPRGFFEKFLSAFGKVLSRPGNEKAAASALPLFQWLLNKPQRFRLEFVWELAQSSAWMLQNAAARLLGQLAPIEEDEAPRLRASLEKVASTGGLSVDAAAWGMAFSLRRGLGGESLSKGLDFYYVDRPLEGREAAVLSLGPLFAEYWPDQKQVLIAALERAAQDENGRVHRHVGSGLLGRLLYTKDAPAVRQLLDRWMHSSQEALRLQALRFLISPAGNDPDCNVQQGLERLAGDISVKIKQAAQLALEKRKT